MKKPFDLLPDGRQAYMYTLKSDVLTAHITDFGATIHRLYVPDREGNPADVVLGFDTTADYKASTTFFGTVVGRGANRTGKARFTLNGTTYELGKCDGQNNLHCGPDFYKDRLWQVEAVSESSITMRLDSPDGDQGFPGNATIRVTYTLEGDTLHMIYDGICDQDTVMNLTNHSYFNLAGHDHPEKAMEQVLMMPARHYTVTDPENIPTGELRSVEGTPMDFRTPKAIGRDIGMDYDSLNMAGGYDHNFEVWCNPCAVVSHPASGRVMEVTTDRVGVQFYAGNFLEGETGKDGVSYLHRGGICLETQFYPDAINHPDWVQPVLKADTPFHSQTSYRFYTA